MTLDSLFQARESFLAMVATVRPELHRYCARLTGSVIEGEDIVQDALAKAFYALSMQTDVPPLRPWLFRIAHNAAIDYLRGHGKKLTDPSDELDLVSADVPPDPATVRAAIARFVALPLQQRSAVILKDVLGFSLEEAAAIMDSTVPGVKAALVRGRLALREDSEQIVAADTETKHQLDRYASLFNARDWTGLRELVAEECRLDLVSKSQRRGKAVGSYFSRYEKEDVRLEPMRIEGTLALAAYTRDSATPGYFILLDFVAGKVSAIRDFRYVPYIMIDVET